MDRSLGEIIKGLMADISTLIRSEIALAKLEVRHSVTKLGVGGIFFLVAGIFALTGVILLIVMLILILAIWLQTWAATLIVALLLFALAFVAVIMGKKKLSSLEIVPKASVESVRTDINAIRNRGTQ
ncbi:MAG: phage holin family protein [Acidobacteria bacterium]|nr:phage holin family protein [Acidobacteriota bacterium]